MPLSINIDSFVPKIDINMNQILFQKGKMKIKLQVCIFEEDEVFISYAPALDLSAFGNTEDEAKREFEQTLHEYITYCLHKKTLERDLLEHGWIVKKKKEFEALPDNDLLQRNETYREIKEKKQYRIEERNVLIPAV